MEMVLRQSKCFSEEISKWDGKESDGFPGLVVIVILMGVIVPFIDGQHEDLNGQEICYPDGKVRIRPLVLSPALQSQWPLSDVCSLPQPASVS